MQDFIARLKRIINDESPRAAAVYMTLTIAALGLSVAVLALIFLSGGVEAAVAVTPEPPAIRSAALAEIPAAQASVQPSPVPLTVEITDQTAAGLILVALRGKIETESVTAHFAAPDALNVSVVITKEALGDFLKAESVPFAGALTLFAPAEITLDVQVGVSAVAEGGLALETRSVSTNGFALSDHLPDSLITAIDASLSAAVPNITALDKVEITDGRAVFTLVV